MKYAGKKNWGGSVKGGSSDDARATRPRVIPISGVTIDLCLEIGLLDGKVKPRLPQCIVLRGVSYYSPGPESR